MAKILRLIQATLLFLAREFLIISLFVNKSEEIIENLLHLPSRVIEVGM